MFLRDRDVKQNCEFSAISAIHKYYSTNIGERFDNLYFMSVDFLKKKPTSGTKVMHCHRVRFLKMQIQIKVTDECYITNKYIIL